VTDSTFPAVLAEQVRQSGARPLVTFYDDATGERTELSAVTYANWVAKTAGLLQDELDLTRGDVVLVDLPTHWLGPVVLGAAWSLGITVTDDITAADSASLVVSGPAGVEEHAGSGRPVLALSLHPMAGPIPWKLPADAVDFGVVVWSQPDAFTAYEPPSPDDRAWRDARSSLTQAELLTAADRSPHSDAGTRLITDENPCSAAGLLALVAPLVAGGGTVWVAHPDPEAWERRSESEHATRHARRS
jgi:uncharacterized protein (TIGR03089 family)